MLDRQKSNFTERTITSRHTYCQMTFCKFCI